MLKYTLFFYLVTTVNAAMTARGRVGADNPGPRDNDNQGIVFLLIILFIVLSYTYEIIRKKYFKPKVDLDKERIKEEFKKKRVNEFLEQVNCKRELSKELFAVYPEFEFSTEAELDAKIIANRYLFDTKLYTPWYEWRQKHTTRKSND